MYTKPDSEEPKISNTYEAKVWQLLQDINVNLFRGRLVIGHENVLLTKDSAPEYSHHTCNPQVGQTDKHSTLVDFTVMHPDFPHHMLIMEVTGSFQPNDRKKGRRNDRKKGQRDVANHAGLGENHTYIQFFRRDLDAIISQANLAKQAQMILGRYYDIWLNHY